MDEYKITLQFSGTLVDYYKRVSNQIGTPQVVKPVK